RALKVGSAITPVPIVRSSPRRRPDGPQSKPPAAARALISNARRSEGSVFGTPLRVVFGEASARPAAARSRAGRQLLTAHQAKRTRGQIEIAGDGTTLLPSSSTSRTAWALI